MSFPRVIILGSLALLAVIGAVGIVKKLGNTPEKEQKKGSSPTLVSLPETPVIFQAAQVAIPLPQPREEAAQKENREPALLASPASDLPTQEAKDDFPEANRIHQLFTMAQDRLPIVETITYTSSVPWLKGRPAWVADYASYYSTSRHFIARSLNGRPDYFTQKVQTGSRFNVFRRDKNIHFYLLVDLSRCKMAFYYIDLDTKERVLLKTYRVGVGRIDPSRSSGSLTPVGKYSLGGKVAIYKPGTMGYFQDRKIEMITVFGTRWIPFEKEIEGCTALSKGYGLHGAPWQFDEKVHAFRENRTCMGKCDSDGCIRLLIEDMEELFSILISRPATIHIVKDFKEAKLPGIEANATSY